jgi:hypothetical protein
MTACSVRGQLEVKRRQAVAGFFSAALTHGWPKAKRCDLLEFFDGRQEE